MEGFDYGSSPAAPASGNTSRRGRRRGHVDHFRQQALAPASQSTPSDLDGGMWMPNQLPSAWSMPASPGLEHRPFPEGQQQGQHHAPQPLPYGEILAYGPTLSHPLGPLVPFHHLQEQGRQVYAQPSSHVGLPMYSRPLSQSLGVPVHLVPFQEQRQGPAYQPLEHYAAYQPPQPGPPRGQNQQQRRPRPQYDQGNAFNYLPPQGQYEQQQGYTQRGFPNYIPTDQAGYLTPQQQLQGGFPILAPNQEVGPLGYNQHFYRDQGALVQAEAPLLQNEYHGERGLLAQSQVEGQQGYAQPASQNKHSEGHAVHHLPAQLPEQGVPEAFNLNTTLLDVVANIDLTKDDVDARTLYFSVFNPGFLVQGVAPLGGQYQEQGPQGLVPPTPQLAHYPGSIEVDTDATVDYGFGPIHRAVDLGFAIGLPNLEQVEEEVEQTTTQGEPQLASSEDQAANFLSPQDGEEGHLLNPEPTYFEDAMDTDQVEDPTKADTEGDLDSLFNSSPAPQDAEERQQVTAQSGPQNGGHAQDAMNTTQAEDSTIFSLPAPVRNSNIPQDQALEDPSAAPLPPPQIGEQHVNPQVVPQNNHAAQVIAPTLVRFTPPGLSDVDLWDYGLVDHEIGGWDLMEADNVEDFLDLDRFDGPSLNPPLRDLDILEDQW